MRRTIFLTFTVLFTLLLVACGGGEETAESADEPQQEAAQAESVEQEAQEAAPTAEPQPTSEPEPTAEPLPTAEPQPTAEPEPTSEPQPEPETASADGWGESGTTAQSACDHPYFPLRTGTTWTMAGAEGDPLTWEVVSVEGDLQSATADMRMRSGDLELQYSWQCSEDGGLASFEFGNQGLAALGPQVTIEHSEGSGTFLPSPQDLVPGFTWDTSNKSTYTMVQVDGDAEIEIAGEMDAMQTSTVLSVEPVSFNDATVPGLLIQQDSDINMVMAILGNEVTNAMSMGGEMELGWGLGMLRQTSFTEFGDFSMTATEIYVP